MSELGDDFKEWRKRRQNERRGLLECVRCGRKLYPALDHICPGCGHPEPFNKDWDREKAARS